MGWEMGEGFRRERTYVYLWLIHVDVWQKPTQCCKAIVLQSKKKEEGERERKKRMHILNKKKEVPIPLILKSKRLCRYGIKAFIK